jgi:hypothetical protein
MMIEDEVFGKFQEFKALGENHIGKKIKVLRFDNRSTPLRTLMPFAGK